MSNPRFYGSSPQASLSEAEVQALGACDRHQGYDLALDYDCTGGQYPYFCYPACYGLPRDVRVGGMRFSDFTLSNVTINGVSYVALRFNNLQHTDMIPVEWR